MEARNRRLTPEPTRALMAFVIGVVLAASARTSGAADLPKEGSFTTTFTIVDIISKEMETIPGRHAWTGEDFVLQMNDAGQGFFHKMTGHCLGAGGNINADGGTKNNGQCAYNDADGDAFYTIYEGGKDHKEDKQRTAIRIVGGSGKYAGIQGQYENTIDWLKSPTETADFGIGHTKGSYKIVPVTQ